MSSGEESKTVSFRLSPALDDLLRERAQSVRRSRGAHARDLLVGVLQDEDRLQVLEELRSAREEVQRLRLDVSKALETVLINIAKVKPDDAQAFVAKVLRP